MKRFELPNPLHVLFGFMIVTLVNCATLRNANGSVNWPLILTDAQFGLNEVCSQQWLNAKECTIGTDIITGTQAVVAKNPTDIKGAVHKGFVDGEAQFNVTPDSKLDQVLRWVIALSA